MWPFTSLVNAITLLSRSIDSINYTVNVWAARYYREFKRPRLPGLLSIRVISEGVNGMLNFSVLLPTPGATDVVKRELSVTIGEEPTQTKELTTETEVTGFSGADNAQVSLSLVDIDDAGNRSPERSQTFVLVDSLAPPQPGEMGIRVDSET